MGGIILGIVFSIQRFSVHDGPGIRTTVFLKGCPLRCLWCHNPESASPEPEIGYHSSRCTLCTECISVCPSGALTVSEGKIIRNPVKCLSCFKCTEACPNGATELYGKSMSSDDIVSAVMRDCKYYQKSGGGVTFSGGEPLLQAKFTAECASKLKEKGIHTAVETSLFGSRQSLRTIMPYIDFYMADIKVMNKDIHEKATGCSNEIILENVVYLAQNNADVLIRIPIIPGINDNEENIAETAEFLIKNTPYRRIELLPMHKLAEHKYEALGRDYPIKSFSVPTAENLELLHNLLIKMGFETNKK